MKIGILTLPLNLNYGGILQAFALQDVLRSMGHEVYVFDNDFVPIYKRPFYKQIAVYILRFVKKIVKHDIIIQREKLFEKEYPVLRKNITIFIDKYIHLKKIKTIDSIELNNFDVLIVGSDQIWRPQYISSMWKSKVEDAFLFFTLGSNIMRIAYAASFGIDSWPCHSKNEVKHISSILNEFIAVSVREKTSINLCQSTFKIKPSLVLDPTLLLTKDRYIEFIKDYPSLGDHKLLSYILDMNDDKKTILNQVVGDKKLQIMEIDMNYSDLGLPLERRVLPSVENWLASFRDADFVVTDSFHACVFSILFNKPFVVIANKERGLSRFTSLLSQFNLQSHLLFSPSDYNSNSDYSLSNESMEKLKQLRKASLNFLIKSLKK